jgi:hypothetical protein
MSSPATGQIAFWKAQQELLEQELTTIHQEERYALSGASRSADCCREALIRLQTAQMDQPFESQAGQIRYYKEIRPFFLSRQYFFSRSYVLELCHPSGGYDQQRPFFDTELSRIGSFQQKYSFIGQYVRSGATYLDDRLFCSPMAVTPPWPDQFSPAGPGPYCFDYVLAQLQGDERLQGHILVLLEELRSPGQSEAVAGAVRLTWTDSKTGLIELAYALQSAGVFNNGKAELKEIIDSLQDWCHINLGNYPRTFQEILSRKTGYTNFLDRLRDKLLLRIQTIEGKYDK